jgi:Flagellar biosynthesis protein, FliO
MIVEHGHTLSHYLMNFILYTLGAIALMYAAYGYTRRRLGLDKDKAAVGSDATAVAAAAPPQMPPGVLLVESTLGLEENKTLYVVKAGNERFLIATSGDSTQCLSRLENEPKPVASPVTAITGAVTTSNGAAIPWFTELQRTPDAAVEGNAAGSGFSDRVLQSLRWLVVSRSPKA